VELTQVNYASKGVEKLYTPVGSPMVPPCAGIMLIKREWKHISPGRSNRHTGLKSFECNTSK